MGQMLLYCVLSSLAACSAFHVFCSTLCVLSHALCFVFCCMSCARRKMIVSGWSLLVIASPLQAELVINIAIKWNQRRRKGKVNKQER